LKREIVFEEGIMDQLPVSIVVSQVGGYRLPDRVSGSLGRQYGL
jgi:hypothetical protein